MLDPRSVANLIVQEAIRRRRPITNLSLQKILYFVHGRFLLETGKPLISGSFEAWKYGPVCLPVYDAFKTFGSAPLTDLAKKTDIKSRMVIAVEPPDDEKLRQKIIDLAVPFMNLSSGRLVELSHAKGSPWDRATIGNPDRIYGLRMSNNTIIEYFKFHKISVTNHPKAGEPDEESPPD